VYRRKLDDKVLSFGHAGILYEQSFIMYDRQTESLWVHVTGEAAHGSLKGKRLEFMPSTVTNWTNWKKNYPHTKVLPGYRRGGFMGTYVGPFRSDILGLAVVVKLKGKLYPYQVLERQNVVNDEFNGAKVVVYYSPDDATATAWRRELDDRVLTFGQSDRKDAQGNVLLRDKETGSLWSWLRGEAVAGPLKGRKLRQLLYNPILNDRFLAFYPGAPVFDIVN
jgi:hypothetical protein